MYYISSIFFCPVLFLFGSFFCWQKEVIPFDRVLDILIPSSDLLLGSMSRMEESLALAPDHRGLSATVPLPNGLLLLINGLI